MGVKGLQSFTENHCEGVCSVVSIERLARDHQNFYRCGQPVLVVDGYGLPYTSFFSNLEWLYGGQWLELLDVLRDFVSRFQRIGVKLVFFFDGCILESKRQEWIGRRQESLRDMENTIRFVKTYHKSPDLKLNTSMGFFMQFFLKYHLNMDVFCSTREADLEISEYAKYNDDVFAIMGQDSDFFIYDTKLYLSSRMLRLDSMTTVLYDRHTLARNLALSVSKLPLLACLLGNDVVPVRMLKAFHADVCRSRGYGSINMMVLAPAVSAVINQNRWKGDVEDTGEWKRISSVVFGNENNFQLLGDGLKWYLLQPASNSKFQDIVERKHVLLENFPPVYHLIRNLEYEYGEALEDPFDESLPPVAIAYGVIRHRSYFVALSGKTDLPVKEWLAYKNNAQFHQLQPNTVNPLSIDIPGGLPSLEDLWGSHPKFHQVRMQCFLKCLDIDLEPAHLNSIAKPYRIFSCILNFLLVRSSSLICMWEVLAFVVQAVRMQTMSGRALKTIKVKWIDARALHLSSLFIHGVETIGMVLSICGYPLPLMDCFPWKFFDGKLFHYTYNRAKVHRRVEDLCKNQKVVSEIYKILSVVTYRASVSEGGL